MTSRALSAQSQAARIKMRHHASANHGVFQRSDLDALGISYDLLRTLVRNGWWTRLHHGVYIDTEVLESAHDPRTRTLVFVTAAMCRLSGGAFAYGPSASLLHGLAMDRRLHDTLALVRPLAHDQRALHRRISHSSMLGSIEVHRHSMVGESTTVIDGVPSQDRWDAAITTAARESRPWALATLDSAVWRDEEGLASLTNRVDRWPGIAGIGTVRSVLPLVRTGAQSPLESLSRFQLLAAGLSEPELQFAIYDESGLVGFADMAWPELRVIGEADGMAKYTQREDLIGEKLREDRMRALGWVVVRWTWREILTTPELVVARIRRAATLARTRLA